MAPNIKVDNPENDGPTVGSGCNVMSALEGMKLVFSSQEYWVFLLFPLSGIMTFRKLDLFPKSRVL
jgi:hypothetical protein